jgi:branched-chain amino acid transport system permease protein
MSADTASMQPAEGALVNAPARFLRQSRLLEWPLIVLGLAVTIALPWVFTTPYWLNLFILIFVYTVVNQSWNLILGFSGILSFAQLALFGLGGYTSALLAHHYGISPYIGTLAGGALAVLASLLIGLPSLRLRGAYVVLLTLAFHEILRNLIVTDTTKWTGGGFGLFGYGQYGIDDMETRSRLVVFYYVALVLLVLASLAIWKVIHSPLGLAFRALRDSEPYAISRGVPEYRFKLIVFATSAFFTGIIGAFYAHYLEAIAPSVFGFGLMMTLMAMIVIGGIGTFWGPILGTVALMLLNEQLRDVEQWRVLIFGAAMVVFVILLPGGLVRPLGTAKNRIGLWLEDRGVRRSA